MKRNKNLQPLSRDHFQALTLAQKIEQSLKGDTPPPLTNIINYVNAFWQNYLIPHFEVEEEFLLPSLASKVGEGNELIERTLGDHQKLKGIQRSLETSVSREEGVRILKEFASELHDHVRFEERELFPAIEKQLTQDELDALGSDIEKLHLIPGHEPFPGG